MKTFHATLTGLALVAAPLWAETPLTVEILTTHTLADVLHYSQTGEIAARRSVNVSFPTGGRLAEILVQEGQSIAQGTLLAQIEAVQQEQGLRAAEAAKAIADADFRQAQEDYNRQAALLERGATTRISRDNAEDRLRVTQSALIQSQAEMEVALSALGDTELRATEAAIVIDRLAEAGEVVAAALPIFTLALGDGIDAVFHVPDTLLSNQITQTTVTIHPLEKDGAPFVGNVREISPLVDATTGTVEILVSIPNPPAYVTFGDPVIGQVSIQGPASITLPFTALSATDSGPAVWVVDPNTMRVSLRAVTVGRYATSSIIITEGLKDGEQVVARGAQLLFPGRTVVAAGERK